MLQDVYYIHSTVYIHEPSNPLVDSSPFRLLNRANEEGIQVYPLA